jgi:hypothetical protein
MVAFDGPSGTEPHRVVNNSTFVPRGAIPRGTLSGDALGYSSTHEQTGACLVPVCASDRGGG